MVETTVLGIEWNASKSGYLKPTIQVNPVSIGGVSIQRATGFNGKFIQENGIGPGAVVLLIRSGDVIPHVNKVMHSVEPQMPNVAYEWTTSGVDIVLKDASNDKQVIAKQLLSFFQGMEVEGIGPGTITKFIDKDYDTIDKILRMTQDDIQQLDGFQEKSPAKIYNNLHNKIKSVSLAKLLGISNLFGRGFGEKRIQSILDVYPTIFETIESKATLLEKITTIAGFSNKTATAFVNNIHRVQGFLDSLGRSYSESSATTSKQIYTHALSGKKVVFSGVRDKSLVEKMSEFGIHIVEQVTKQTSLLIVKDKNDITSKIEKANKFNIPILSIDEFHL